MAPSLSSSSDVDAARYAEMEEKKRKRMLSNRESARRSRMKKQRRIEELIKEQSALKRSIADLHGACSAVAHKICSVEMEKEALMEEKLRLTQNLNQLVLIHKGFKQNSRSVNSKVAPPWPAAAEALPVTTLAGMLGI